MNLSPEEKEVGKENFYAAIGSKAVRRDFLQKAHPPGRRLAKRPGSATISATTVRARAGPRGRHRHRRRGSVLVGALNPKYIAVKAIADIRPYNVHRAFHGDCYSRGRERPARPDGGLRMEDRDGGPRRSQGLRRLQGTARPRQGGRHRGGDHRPAAAPARPGGDRRHAGRAARADREAHGPQRPRVQGNGPRGQGRPSCSWPPATSGTTASSTTTRWRWSAAGCWATCTTSAPNGTAATCPATTVGSSRCRRA